MGIFTISASNLGEPRLVEDDNFQTGGSGMCVPNDTHLIREFSATVCQIYNIIWVNLCLYLY